MNHAKTSLEKTDSETIGRRRAYDSPPTAFVVPGATIIGDATVGEESSVWYGAVLRGNISRIVIGPRSNIQDNAAILIDHNSSTIRWRAGHGRSLCDRPMPAPSTTKSLSAWAQSFTTARKSVRAPSSARTHWSPLARKFRPARSSLVHR